MLIEINGETLVGLVACKKFSTVDVTLKSLSEIKQCSIIVILSNKAENVFNSELC